MELAGVYLLCVLLAEAYHKGSPDSRGWEEPVKGMESQRDGELEPFLQSMYHTQSCIKVPGERIIVYQVVHEKPVKIRVDLCKRDQYFCVSSS